MKIGNGALTVCQASSKAFSIGCTCTELHGFTVETAVLPVNAIDCQENSNPSRERATFHFSMVFSLSTQGVCPEKILKKSWGWKDL